TPQQMNLSTRDGRGGTGPWTYELGVKFTVDQPMLLSAVEFYKSDQETGSHTGTLWSASGTKLASVVFQNETASGWQKQNLASPLSLQPDTTYVVSVDADSVFGFTQSGLAAQINNGPLHSVA